MSADHSYDIALSYLREEHADDARELATRLRKAGYSVFFDEFEEAEMWGQVLEEKLESIYRDEARFCVMFVSAAYIARPWTRHERRVAIARAARDGVRPPHPLRRLRHPRAPGRSGLSRPAKGTRSTRSSATWSRSSGRRVCLRRRRPPPRSRCSPRTTSVWSWRRTRRLARS